eukprot:757022-Amphidinium_carterae.2
MSFHDCRVPKRAGGQHLAEAYLEDSHMQRDKDATVQERLERDLLKKQVTAGPTEAAVAVQPESRGTAQTGGAGSTAGLVATEAAEAVLPRDQTGGTAAVSEKNFGWGSSTATAGADAPASLRLKVLPLGQHRLKLDLESSA